MLERKKTDCEIQQTKQDVAYVCSYAASILEIAHERSHAQTASVRKAANDKAREDRAIARDHQKKRVEETRGG